MRAGGGGSSFGAPRGARAVIYIGELFLVCGEGFEKNLSPT
jgi:hypothetical protein